MQHLLFLCKKIKLQNPAGFNVCSERFGAKHSYETEPSSKFPSGVNLSTLPLHHHYTAGRVSQAVEKSEEDDLKMAAFPKALDGQTCPGELSKLLVHGQRFQLEIEQRMRSAGPQIISSNPDQT